MAHYERVNFLISFSLKILLGHSVTFTLTHGLRYTQANQERMTIRTTAQAGTTSIGTGNPPAQFPWPFPYAE